MSNTGIYWNIEMENLLNIPQMREIQAGEVTEDAASALQSQAILERANG